MAGDIDQTNGNTCSIDCKYKYDILIKLRDHEHTVLWQKFNVFLGFNTIIIAIIAAITSIQKFGNTSQIAHNITKENTIQSYFIDANFLLITIFLFFCIFLIAFVCSIFVSRILKGSDYWIEFWESKLYLTEPKITTSSTSDMGIFVDHPSRAKKELTAIIHDKPDEITPILKEKIEKWRNALEIALDKKYLSTRRNMERFIRAITYIWGFFFIGTGSVFFYELFKTLFPFLSNQIIIIPFFGVLLIAITYGIHKKYVDDADKNEIEDLIKKADQILHN